MANTNKNSFLYEIKYVKHNGLTAEDGAAYYVSPDLESVLKKLEDAREDKNIDIVSINKVVRVDEILEF